MINTDKYKGHTPPPWIVQTVQSEHAPHGNDLLITSIHAEHNEDVCVVEIVYGGNNCLRAKEDARLIADAPLLLEEVKRLREQLKLAYDWVDTQFPDGGMADFAEYIGDEEE